MPTSPNFIHPTSRAEGIWLISYKKATGKPRFDYAEAVEEVLCFGWIDSKPGLEPIRYNRSA